jgi:hypothetical protein
MTEQDRVRHDAEPAHPVWGEPFEGQLASGPDPAKVVALTKAVELYLEHYAANEPATMYQQVVDGARQFEAYLNGEETP